VEGNYDVIFQGRFLFQYIPGENQEEHQNTSGQLETELRFEPSTSGKQVYDITYL
jgi:hypothetical protein